MCRNQRKLQVFHTLQSTDFNMYFYSFFFTVLEQSRSETSHPLSSRPLFTYNLVAGGGGVYLHVFSFFLSYRIFKKSMGARNRGGIRLSYRPARLQRLAEFIPWSQQQGPINMRSVCLLISFFKLMIL